MAKHKYIKSPAKMWEYFKAYVEEVNSNPIQRVEQKKGNLILPKDFKGNLSDLSTIVLPLQRPLTMEGFENYCADNGIIADLSQYFANTEGRYKSYQTICSRVKKVIRQNQIEGGMAGIFNHSITARLNNLTEKSDINYSNLPDEALDKIIDTLIEKNNQKQ